MVKLATARECRLYGPWLSRNRWEYINAGIYLFATILLVCGFVSQFSSMSAKSGLIIMIISLVILALVNCHDLLAHMAGIDYRLPLMGTDIQLGLVEFAVPVVQAVGSILFLLGILFIFIQAEEGRGYFRLERLALNLFVAGPVLWVIGSILNTFQIYERADGHVQILQKGVQIPFLIGSLLFAVGSILNKHDRTILRTDEPTELIPRHGLGLLGKRWVWLGIYGSLFLFIGGLVNLVKVFKIQQMDGVRLEKLRGGAQDRLVRERDGRVPLIEEHRRREKESEVSCLAPSATTPYKDALVSQP